MVPAPFLVAVTVAWPHTTTVAWRLEARAAAWHENEMVRCPAPAPATVAWPMKKPVAWTGTRTASWREEVWAAEPGGATTVDSEENEMVQWLARATVDWPRRKGKAWLMKWASYLARLPVPLTGYAEAGTACRGRTTAAARRQRP